MRRVRGIMLIKQRGVGGIQPVPLRKQRSRWIDTDAINRRIDRDLQDHRERGWSVTQRQRRYDRQVAAGTVTAQHQPGELAPEPGTVPRDPARGGFGIFGGRRPGVFGCQPIVHRYNRYIDLPGDFCGQAGVGLDGANGKPATVVKDDNRPGFAIDTGIE